MELPLFPLNSVLFPGMPLKLHIFEERYKLMINECIENKAPFGVVLIKSGAEVGPIAQPYMVGTTAYITQAQKLSLDRMNVLSIGRERFRINSLHNDKPYLSGLVDYFPMKKGSSHINKLSENYLKPLVERYLATLEEIGQVQLDDENIPAEPLSLAYLAAIILQIENETKQQLLELGTTHELLVNLVHTYQREVALLDAMLSYPEDEKENNTPFSLN